MQLKLIIESKAEHGALPTEGLHQGVEAGIEGACGLGMRWGDVSMGYAADDILTGSAAVNLACVTDISDTEEIKRQFGAEVGRKLIYQRGTQADAPCEVADTVDDRVEILYLAAVEGFVVALAQCGIAQ